MPTNSRIVRNEEELNRRPPAKSLREPAQTSRRGPDNGTLNSSLHAERKATVVTEENRTGHASRKSTRASSHHGKNSQVLEHMASVRSATPAARHAKR